MGDTWLEDLFIELIFAYVFFPVISTKSAQALTEYVYVGNTFKKIYTWPQI